MNKKIDSRIVASSLGWKFAERLLAQVVSTVVSVLLARMLLPSEYGVVTMVLVFINIANVFVTSGFGQALIQEKNSGDLEFSTMTVVSVLLSIALYVVLFCASPYIADFYHQPKLCLVLRVLALKIPIAGYNTIQQAYVQKHMMFKKIFIATFGGTLLSGVAGCVIAYLGYGYWALVTQYLLNAIVDTIALSFCTHWRPKKMFSAECAKRLFSFSWKLTVGDLVGTIYNEIKALIIGRVYSSADLAYFSKGEQFPKLVIDNINTSIISVLYPTMAKVNDTIEDVKFITRKSIQASAFFLFPALVGLSVVAEPFLVVLLTEKWLPAVPFLQLACYSYITVPLSSANLQALKALGRSDIVMRLEIFKKMVGLLLIFVAMRFGVLEIAWAGVIYSIVAVIANASPNRKLMGYTYKEQILDLLPYAGLSAIMGVITYHISLIGMTSFSTLIIQIIAAIIVYLSLAYVLKLEIMMLLIGFFKRKVLKHGKN